MCNDGDEMNPFKWWLNCWEIWIQMFVETRALRACHNQNRSRIELIERALREEGMLR